MRKRAKRERERASLFFFPSFFFFFSSSPLFLFLSHLFSAKNQNRNLISNEPRGPGPLRGPRRRAQGPRRAGAGPGVGAVPPGAQDGGQGRFFFFPKEREEEKLQSAVAPLRCSSPALFFASNRFVRGPKIIPSSSALSNATSEAFYSANLRLEKKKKGSPSKPSR